MKFDPIHNALYTDDGRLIKRLHCPKSLAWDELREGRPFQRFCAICEVNVIDTAQETEESMLDRMKKEPNSCLKLDIHQPNIKIINHGDYNRE